MRGRQGFGQMCSIRKYQFREAFIKASGPFLVVVLTKLYIPSHYDLVGQGGAAHHPLQGGAVVGLRPGEELVEWTGVPLELYESQSYI